MPFYYYIIILLSILALVVLLIRLFLVRKKSFPDQLFTEALKNENSGRFEEALATYKIALAEIKKRKHRSNLENMIIEKIKVLDTNIEYNNDIRLNPSAEGG